MIEFDNLHSSECFIYKIEAVKTVGGKYE